VEIRKSQTSAFTQPKFAETPSQYRQHMHPHRESKSTFPSQSLTNFDALDLSSKQKPDESEYSLTPQNNKNSSGIKTFRTPTKELQELSSLIRMKRSLKKQRDESGNRQPQMHSLKT